MPWCQLQRGNIIVDFFTAQRVAAHHRAARPLPARLLLGLAMALLAWRTTLGGINAWKSGSGTMLIGFPEWLIYVGDGAAAGADRGDRDCAQAVRGFPPSG